MTQKDIHLTQNTASSGIEFEEKIVNLTPGAVLKADANGLPTEASAEVDYIAPDTDLLLHLDQTTPQSITGGAPVFDAIDFDTTPALSGAFEGRLQWNATDGTLNLGMDGGNIIQQIGQELFIKVVNKTGTAITNGTPVYFSGRQGNRPKITPSRSDTEATSRVMGVTTQDIADNDEGYITSFGYVRQIKTNYSGAGIWGTTWAEGDPLYTSKTNAGTLTNVEPDAPHHADIVATVGVVGALGIGSILVGIERHKTLAELADINGTPLSASGQFPVWNETLKVFDFDHNISEFGGSGTGDVTGPASSTAGNLAVFADTTGKVIEDGGPVPTVPTDVSDLSDTTGLLDFPNVQDPIDIQEYDQWLTDTDYVVGDKKINTWSGMVTFIRCITPHHSTGDNAFDNDGANWYLVSTYPYDIEALSDTTGLIPSITGLLDETAHDALDHTGLTGIPDTSTFATKNFSIAMSVAL